MKTLLTILLICVTTLSFSQDKENYNKIMTSTIAKLDTVQSISACLKLSNKFERIASAEKTEWLPYYYAAYSKVIGSLAQTDKSMQTQWLKEVDALLRKSEALSPDNSENYVIRSLWYTCMIQNEGFSSIQKYESLSNKALEKAELLNEDNPRVYYTRGLSLFYTHPQYGGDRKSEALPEFEKGIGKFNNFQPESDIHPTWGKEQCARMINACKHRY